MTEHYLTIGAWLRRRRKALDLIQAQPAVRAGGVLTTIKKIAPGARSHPVGSLSVWPMPSRCPLISAGY
jgi:hypothetical protein